MKKLQIYALSRNPTVAWNHYENFILKNNAKFEREESQPEPEQEEW